MARYIESVAAPSLSAPESPGLRLSLASGLDRRGAVDGGWWPRSRDAAAELAQLLAGLVAPLGAVTRLTVDADDWDGVPRRIAVGDRMVKVGWFPNLDHMVIVTRRQDEILLLVVPPEADEKAAHHALDRAAAGADSDHPMEILAGCGITPAGRGAADSRTHTAATPAGPNGGRPVLRLVPDESVDKQHPHTADGDF